MDVVGSYGNHTKWWVIRDNIVVEEKDNKQTGLRLFEFTVFDGFEELDREGLWRFPYFFIWIVMQQGIQEDKSEQMKNLLRNIIDNFKRS